MLWIVFALPYPYKDAKVTDAKKLAAYAGSYREVLAGRATAASLPDPTDLLLPEAKRALLIEPSGPTPSAVFNHCSQCHNPTVRPGLARARFDATHLEAMPREEKDRAIERVALPADDPRHMPPAVYRDLGAASRTEALAELKR